MKQKLLSIFVLSFLMFGSEIFAQNGHAKKSPNIILIVADDLGWNDVGPNQTRDIDTPNLNKLAKDGMLFNNAYASAPVCSPSRAGIITGQYPARIGLTNHISRQDFTPKNATWLDAPTLNALPTDYITFAEVLKENGYRTGFFGKWHLSINGKGSKEVEDPSTLPDHQGFDINVGGGAFGGPPSWFAPFKNPYIKDGVNGEYLPERLASEVIRFISADRSAPFLAVYWEHLVHSPIETTEALTEKYKKRAKEGKDVGSPVYAGMIEALDMVVGRVLKAVDDLNLSDETLIVFTSDNGGISKMANNGDLKFGKGWPYEGGIRVPLIIRWAGKVKPATVSNSNVINTDFFPTFLATAGIKKKYPNIDGENLLPLVTKGKELVSSIYSL